MKTVKRLVLSFLALVVLVPGPSAIAQPEPEPAPEPIPTRLIEGAGLDIFAGATGPEGRMFRGRPQAEFDLLFELERSFVDEIEEDAKQVVFE